MHIVGMCCSETDARGPAISALKVIKKSILARNTLSGAHANEAFERSSKWKFLEFLLVFCVCVKSVVSDIDNLNQTLSLSLGARFLRIVKNKIYTQVGHVENSYGATIAFRILVHSSFWNSSKYGYWNDHNTWIDYT